MSPKTSVANAGRMSGAFSGMDDIKVSKSQMSESKNDNDEDEEEEEEDDEDAVIKGKDMIFQPLSL